MPLARWLRPVLLATQETEEGVLLAALATQGDWLKTKVQRAVDVAQGQRTPEYNNKNNTQK